MIIQMNLNITGPLGPADATDSWLGIRDQVDRFRTKSTSFLKNSWLWPLWYHIWFIFWLFFGSCPTGPSFSHQHNAIAISLRWFKPVSVWRKTLHHLIDSQLNDILFVFTHPKGFTLYQLWNLPVVRTNFRLVLRASKCCLWCASEVAIPLRGVLGVFYTMDL